jgi:hypothetical protein
MPSIFNITFDFNNLNQAQKCLRTKQYLHNQAQAQPSCWVRQKPNTQAQACRFFSTYSDTNAHS